jgi:Cu-Zn family superoxide dismutase
VIHPASDSKVHGTVRFQKTSGGVHITADLRGLSPGPHGFHIHEFGDCSAADASSAGGHYNPEGNPHGAPDAPRHHAGDFGNIHANDEGEAQLKTTVGFISIDGAHSPILGRAVVVHAGKDDLTSQPSGDAGARVGCGVIGLAKSQ